MKEPFGYRTRSVAPVAEGAVKAVLLVRWLLRGTLIGDIYGGDCLSEVPSGQ